jgi:hypothetical protein
MQRASDAVYLLTKVNWGSARPIEAVKISEEGKVIWRTAIAETFVAQAGSAFDCKPGHTLLDNEDLLIACPLRERMLLVRLSSRDGNAAHTYVALPECHGGYAPTLFPLREGNGSIWLFGSRPIGARIAGCTWLGSVSLRW